MKKCIVPNCKNTQHNKENLGGVSFHRIPKNEVKRMAWIAAIGLKCSNVSKWAVVCSEHFSEDCFDRTSACGLIRLREHAIPNVFVEQNIIEDMIIEEEISLDNPVNLVDVEHPDADVSFTSSNIATQTSQSFYMDLASRQDILAELVALNRKYKLLRRKYINLLKTKKRKDQKVITLKTIIADLRKNNLISEDNLNVLANCSLTTKELCSRQLKRTGKYSPELRKFAMTLHFYSAKAYNYVRRQFKSSLPHPKTISSWYRSVDGNPGFTSQSFDAIKVKQTCSTYQIVGNLVFDEMAIRSKIEWFAGKYYGYEDFGGKFIDDSSELAKQALVFLLTGVNVQWKIPLGYFLCKSVTGLQKKELLLTCLTLLNETGVIVNSVTFDGASTNLTMAESLGCNIKNQELKTYFVHPVTKNDIFVFVDICHVIKMVRNAFADKKIFIDENGEIVSWHYIELLHSLQEAQKFHIANKLTKSHIHFKTQIMKVKLATQVLSNSVAEALLICADDLKLKQFEGVHATVKFIQNFNQFFDIFNTKNMFLFNYKQAMNVKNEHNILSFFVYFDSYLKNIVIKSTGQNVLYSNRKTGFLGARINMESLKLLYFKFRNNSILAYIPTYKFNQDHIELFFYSIRSSLGDNNNPSVRQFMAAYKKILVHAMVKEGVSGNCIPLENISILHVSSRASESFKIINNSCTKNNSCVDNNVSDTLPVIDHDYEGDIGEIILNNVTEKIVVYIAGYVVAYLRKKIKCLTCIKSLYSTETSNNYYSIIRVKNKGGLIFPSADVVQICLKSEEILKLYLMISIGNILDKKYTIDFMVSKILLKFVYTNVFQNLKEHMYEQTESENHVVHLIKTISCKYLSIRLSYLNRHETDEKSKFKKSL